MRGKYSSVIDIDICRSSVLTSSPVAGLSSENVVNGIFVETTPSTSEYGSSMKVGTCNAGRKFLRSFMVIYIDVIIKKKEKDTKYRSKFYYGLNLTIIVLHLILLRPSPFMLTDSLVEFSTKFYFFP